MNLVEALTSECDPAAPFLIGERSMATYGDVTELAGRFRAVLAAHGVENSDRVIAITAKSVEAVSLYLAVTGLGAVYVPLNPGFTQSELAYYFEDAEPAAVVHGGDLPVPPTPDGVVTFTLDAHGGTLAEAAGSVVEPLPTVRVGPDETAAMLYTSGTTGRPKGALLSHGSLLVNARALHETWAWRADDVLLHALPIFHVHGLFVALHTAMLGGSSVLFHPRFDPGRVCDQLQGASVFMGVPTMYHRLIEQPALGDRSSSMRLFVSGSAPLAPSTSERFTAITGHRILERYGMTEAGMICSNPYDGERRPGTVGFPIAGYSVKVLDENDRSVAEGDTGVLAIRGRSLFSGYWRRPKSTAAAFTPDGYFRTGDLASRDEEGRITLVGRTSDLVISGGYNVYPAEVEAVLDRVPGVEEVAVVGAADADLGEVVVAFVVGEAGERELVGAAEAGLVAYKRPRRYVHVDSLPRNAMGKVQKAELRRLTGGRSSSPNS